MNCCFLLVTGLLLAFKTAQAQCPNDSIEVSQQCYFRFNRTVSWQQAKDICIMKGFHLALVNTTELGQVLESPLAMKDDFWVESDQTVVKDKWEVIKPVGHVEQAGPLQQVAQCAYLSANVTITYGDCSLKLSFMCMSSVEDERRKNYTGCPVKWFGSHCQFRCHCLDGWCHRNGSCFNGDSCSASWFGISCQYKNIATTADGIPPALLDSDENSCEQMKSIAVEWSEPTRFTWLMIETFQEANLGTITFTYSTNDRIFICENTLITASNDSTVEIECFPYPLVERITVSWPFHALICGLRISGGRNLAIKRPVVLSSSDRVDELQDWASVVVDGSINEPCAVTDKCDTNPNLTMTFQHPINIFKMKLTFGQAALKVDFLNISYKPVGKTAVGEVIDGPFGSTLEVSAIVKSPIEQMMVSLQNYVLEICELEIFGECAALRYGLDCSEFCSKSCHGSRCKLNGNCHSCPEGKTGPMCEADKIESSTHPFEVERERGELKKVYNGNVYLYLVLGVILIILMVIGVISALPREMNESIVVDTKEPEESSTGSDSSESSSDSLGPKGETNAYRDVHDVEELSHTPTDPAGSLKDKARRRGSSVDSEGGDVVRKKRRSDSTGSKTKTPVVRGKKDKSAAQGDDGSDNSSSEEEEDAVGEKAKSPQRGSQ